MNAYLIDPEARRITVERWHRLTAGSKQLEKIYSLLGCDTIDAVHPWAHTDAIYVDDEGLQRGPVYQFFAIRGYPQPLAGRGLVVGVDGDGNDQSPRMDLPRIIEETMFIERLVGVLWGICPASNPKAVEVVPYNEMMRRLGG